MFFGRNDVKAETPVLWPPHASRHHAKQEENRGPEARTQVVPVWGWTQGTAQLISLAPGESRTGPADTPDSAVGNGKNPLLWGQTLQAPCLSVSGSIPWRSKWQPTPALLPGKSHGLLASSGAAVELGSRQGWETPRGFRGPAFVSRGWGRPLGAWLKLPYFGHLM